MSTLKTTEPMVNKNKENYLKKELYELIKTDERIFDFIQKGSLDGLWYWDLENPENEWMNAKFWTVLGYDPDKMPHKSNAWQHIINHNDLKVASENLSRHCENPDHPYDQVVRYTHKDGSTVWIRCRGFAIRDKEGIPVRMLGAHQDISDVKRKEQEIYKAKEKAEESEAQYRRLFENMNNGFVLFEVVQNEQGIPVDLIILTGNEEFEKTVGLKLKDIAGRQLTKVLPGIENDEADWIGTYSNVALTGKSTKFEQGSEVLGYYFSVSAFQVGPKLCAVTFSDITEKKRAEIKLKESEYRFRRIFEDNPNGMVMVSKDFKFLKANQSFCEWVGYTEEELQMLTFVDITHPDDREKDIPHIKKMISGGIKSYSTEKRFLGKDGQTYWGQVTVSPFYDSNGQFLYNLAMIVNITVAKLAELDHRRMSRIMKNAQEIANLGSFEYVAADQTTIWSEEEYRIYGLDPNGPSPKYDVMLEECIHPDDAKLLHDTFMTAIQNKGVYELEHRIVRPDGSVRWVHDKAHPYFDENGNLLRYVGATLDITERMHLQKELEILNAELEMKVKQRTAQLESSNKELEAFSYSVSHDLRAPLRHISGYVELLNECSRDELPTKSRHYLDTVSRSSEKMGLLIDALLQYSRFGRQEIIKKEFDMNLIVEKVIDQLKKNIEKRKIIWEIQELPTVRGDDTLISQVWANLIENAIKYTGNQKAAEISLGYKEEEKDFVFWIKDNGAGFDMEYAHKLFGVFQRLHSQSEFEGIGIGLANVQRIIHKHMGRVWAEAEAGKGANFYFTLPK